MSRNCSRICHDALMQRPQPSRWCKSCRSTGSVWWSWSASNKKLKLYHIQLYSTYSRMIFDSTWFHNLPVMIHGFAMFVVVSFQIHYFFGCWDSVITVTWWCVMPCIFIQCESLNSALNDLVLSSRWVDIRQGINQDDTRTYYLVRYVLRLHIAQGLSFHLKVSGDRDLTV